MVSRDIPGKFRLLGENLGGIHGVGADEAGVVGKIGIAIARGAVHLQAADGEGRGSHLWRHCQAVFSGG